MTCDKLELNIELAKCLTQQLKSKSKIKMKKKCLIRYVNETCCRNVEMFDRT